MSEHVRGVVTEIEDEPHIEGRRLTVRRIGALAEKRGLPADAIADRFDLSLAEVYNALSFYHAHADLMAELESDRQRRIEHSREGAIDPAEVFDDATGR